ncbi:MAG TPA: DHA2 family efflux MFS transporter permease subunit [Rhizomicrobium sp.]|nr:DHA2 family efflux MFS transporter permease subunit [Rhizomicrobium sp.]
MPSTIRTWIGYTAMCIGMFMAILDIQVVASSLTVVQHALKIPTDRISWIQTGYLIAEVIAIPLTGVLTRALSLRWMFVGAILGFTLSSLGCAASANGELLIGIRVVQGFFGGMLIPAVFTSVFTILPRKHEILATTMAGVFAMVAPTIGPYVGGWLTEHYSWHWIFLINIAPGIFVSLVVAACIRTGKPDFALLGKIDYATVALAALFLGSLELLLKQAPQHHWTGPFIYSLFALCALSGSLTGYLCLNRPNPFVDLTRFRHGPFAVGCLLSFVVGMGLYGSTYIVAVFLGLVRGHTPLEIGEIMMVAGIAQLIAAPLAALAESRIDGRLMIGLGYGIFAIGLFLNGQTTFQSDYDNFFWPQILRGVAIMMCILPSTRLAMESWPPQEAADASGLFNLMRNLGGAIGIALIDTILESRTPDHAAHIVERLQHGDPNFARLVGLPVEYFHGQDMGPVDPAMRAFAEPMIQRAAMVQSFNEAWIVLGALFLLVLFALPFVKGRDAHPSRTI